MVDYYRILEVPRNAPDAEIKKAYRRLALKWHPDKNPESLEEAKLRFQEISEAYQVLGDERKRRIYDQYGTDVPGRRSRRSGRASGPGHASHMHSDLGDEFFGPAFTTFTFRDPEEVFREFFGGDPFADFFNHMMPARGGMFGNSLFSNMFGFPGMTPGFPSLFDADMGFASFNSLTAIGGPPGMMPGAVGGSVRRTSTSTRFINGKKITTKRVYENGNETVTVIEDGMLVSQTVNGIPQAIAYN